MKTLALLLLLIADNGQWEDLSPTQRQWFRSPLIVPCCNIADGHRTDWEIRKDGYWVPNPLDTKIWIPVPPNTVVQNAGNPIGEAIIWWVPSYEEGIVKGILIHCFVPGGGV